MSCEPQQRTLVRPVMVNGAAVSQVECITDGAALAATTALPAGGYAAPVPVAYRQPLPAATPVRYVPLTICRRARDAGVAAGDRRAHDSGAAGRL